MASKKEDMEKFGQWIRAEREKRGWSQRTLSERVGVVPSRISSLEGGKGSPSELLKDALYRLFQGSGSKDIYDELRRYLKDDEIELIKHYRQLPKKYKKIQQEGMRIATNILVEPLD